MNALLFLTLAAVFVLMLTLVWALRSPEAASRYSEARTLDSLNRPGRDHATYVATICQAMSSEDFQFLETRAPARALRRAHCERQRIAALYLLELRAEFYYLLRLARLVALLSPEVRAAQELERLRLTQRFFWRYQIVATALYFGVLLLPQLCGLTAFVSQLAVRMDELLGEVAERAALANDVASSLDRRRLDLA